MRRSPGATIIILFVLILFTIGLNIAVAQEATEEPISEATQAVTAEPVTTETPTATATSKPATTGETYTVQAGDNLYRIALRFGTSTSELAAENGIVSPSLIYVGQVLKIPGSQSSEEPITAGAQTAIAQTYTTVAGDTLFRIAIRFDTTVTKLLEANNISNANVIYVGQTLNIPGTEKTDSSTATSDTTDTTPVTLDADFDYGIELLTDSQDANTLAAQAAQLGMSWVKVDIAWKNLEPIQGQIDFTSTDAILSAVENNNLKVLFTISTAPTWARTSIDEDGPPDDFADFGTFVGALAQRYAGRVDAYEIWNEPNLRRSWNSETYPIRADYYVDLLSEGFAAIKAADPDALVISAGLAPTGFNDGINAIHDRVFLQDMYSNQVGDYSDAIGAHAHGWANPPDTTCCDQPEGVETHYDDPSFFFKNTLEEYREIMVRNGDGDTPIWVTKFGWGTSEDTDAPGQANIFLTYTSLTEQASYITRGFQLGSELGYVGPMFLYNLNGCLTASGQAEACYYSLISPNATARPAFGALQVMDKSNASSAGAAAAAPIVQATPTVPLVQTPAALIPETTVEATQEVVSP